MDIKIWYIAQELVKCKGRQYSSVQGQNKYKNLLKKYKDISDAKNHKKETIKPWKFYDAFRDPKGNSSKKNGFLLAAIAALLVGMLGGTIEKLWMTLPIETVVQLEFDFFYYYECRDNEKTISA